MTSTPDRALVVDDEPSLTGWLPAQAHVDEAFAGGVLIASAVGVTVALAAALVVTWLVARRVAAPVTDAAEAAQ